MITLLKNHMCDALGGELSLEELLTALPPEYVDHLEALYETSLKSGINEEQLRNVLFIGKLPDICSNAPGNIAENDLWHALGKPFYSKPHNGLVVECKFEFAGFDLKIGPLVKDSDGSTGIHWSEFDTCYININVKKTGLCFGAFPNIFGAVYEYEKWSRYYGDEARNIKGEHPENRIAHHRFVLRLLELHAKLQPDMGEDLWHHAKGNAFDTMFRVQMPGVVGLFHGGNRHLHDLIFVKELPSDPLRTAPQKQIGKLDIHGS